MTENRNEFFHTICYGDDAVLFRDYEEYLQRSVHSLNSNAQELNVLTNTENTKYLLTFEQQKRCK